ncbi:MAG: hypothetical protein ACREUN_08240, partial [Burkholderiales bacterium]
MEQGGKLFCGAQKGKPWGYSLCDEAAPYGARATAWCIASGGTPGGPSGCDGATPHTEENMVARSIKFAEELRGAGVTCSLAADTSWGTSFFSNFCWNATDHYSDGGELFSTFRRLTVSCSGGGGELVSASKGRAFECPLGYTPGMNPVNG